MKVDYVKTERGVISCLYKGMKGNSKAHGRVAPNFSKEACEAWLYENDYKKVYEEWKDSNFDRWQRPTVDRVDSKLPYLFENMEVVTVRENRDRQSFDAMHGLGTSGEQCKPVRCVFEDGAVAFFVSVSSAMRAVGFSINYQLKTGAKDRGGRRWEYVQ